jgi:hypothetical protein
MIVLVAHSFIIKYILDVVLDGFTICKQLLLENLIQLTLENLTFVMKPLILRATRPDSQQRCMYFLLSPH